MNIGERITLGNHGAEPIVWKAIAREDSRYLLLSERVLDYRPFHPVDISQSMGYKDYYETDWGNCELRSWLNGEFADSAFSAEELAHIPTVTVEYNTVYKTLHSFYRGTEKSEDRIFLLSEEECRKYLSDEDDRVARLTEYARTQAQDVCPQRNYGAWWLRTIIRDGYGGHSLYVYNFVRDGQLVSAILSPTGAEAWSRDVGVRPAMWYQP